MFCVLADDTHHATAVNDLALVTDLLTEARTFIVIPFFCCNLEPVEQRPYLRG